MTTLVPIPSPRGASAPAASPSARTALIVLTLLLVSNGPLFVCMPLTNDAEMYDLQARVWLDGGVLYRDVLEPNLPGAVWVHAAVRTLFGDSSEALRLFDLFAFSAIVLLLVRWLAETGRSPAVQGWCAVALFLFYLSISEWSHCQRDTWMLLPALAALHLRRRQTLRIAETPAARSLFLAAAAEGAVWGAAIWLKPMIVLPLLAAWLISLALHRRPRAIAADAAGLLAGGVAVGAAGVAWLVASGSWPYLYEMLTEWNPRYFAAGKEHWTSRRFAGMAVRFFPWLLLHAAAAPWAVYLIIRELRRHTSAEPGARSAGVLLAGFYLAWLVQSFFLQHLFDYVHAPAILLAAALLAAAPPAPVQWRRAAAVGFLGLAVLVSPAFQSDRLAVWGKCWTEGSSPEVRSRLVRYHYPDWQDLERAADYLRAQDARDGEVTCFHNSLISLYNQLGLRPSTRYAYLEALLSFFPERHPEIRAALASSRQKYLVTDLTATGLPREKLHEGLQGERGDFPPAFPEQLKQDYPWRYPVEFRAGSILVHRLPAASPSAAE